MANDSLRTVDSRRVVSGEADKKLFLHIHIILQFRVKSNSFAPAEY